MTNKTEDCAMTLDEFVSKLAKDEEVTTAQLIDQSMRKLNNLTTWAKMLICLGNYQIELDEQADPEPRLATRDASGKSCRQVLQTPNKTRWYAVFRRNGDLKGELQMYHRDMPDSMRHKPMSEMFIIINAYPQSYYCLAEARAWQLLAGFVFYRETKTDELTVYLKTVADTEFFIHM